MSTPQERIQQHARNIRQEANAITAEVLAMKPTPPMTPPIVVIPPPIPPATSPPRAPSGPLDFYMGVHLVENLAIQADAPYLPPNSSYYAGGQGISTAAGGKLTVNNCGIKAQRYGIWIDLDEISLDHTNIECSGDDDYCCRGDVQKWRSSDCTFKSNLKAVIRLYGVTDLLSARDTFEGPRMLLGRGDSDEHVNPRTFVGAFVDGKIKCEVIVGPKSNAIFTRMDFAGSAKITVDLGGICTLNQCKNVPPIDGVATVNP